METYLKNNLILEEIKNNNLNDLEKIIVEIEGEITLEKIYEKIFKDLKINLYSTKDGKFYIELKRYIEKFTDNQCKEIKLLNNKFAVDKNKIKKLSEININNSYIYNKLTNSKKLIEINGLQTVNDSLKRFNNDLDDKFFEWENLISINIPKIIETAFKKYFKQEFDKVYAISKYQQEQIDMLKEDLDIKTLEIKNLNKKLTKIVKFIKKDKKDKI